MSNAGAIHIQTDQELNTDLLLFRDTGLLRSGELYSHL